MRAIEESRIVKRKQKALSYFGFNAFFAFTDNEARGEDMGKLINLTQGNCTVVPSKVFEDTRLNFYAKGLLCTIYSLPTNQPVTVKSLCLQIPEDMDIKETLNSLSRYGYLVRDEKDGEEIWQTI